MGVLLKKMENGGCCFGKKSGKWGVFFVKKVELSSTQGALCTVSVFFYFTFYLFGGAYAPNAPPAAYGPVVADVLCEDKI